MEEIKQETPKKFTLPESLTTVTKASKLLALFLFIMLPFIGFLFGSKFQEVYKVNNLSNQLDEIEANTKSSINIWELTRNGCGDKECLLRSNEDFIGITTIKGYANKYEEENIVGNKETCYEIILLDGRPEFLEKHEKISYPINYLTAEQKNLFLNSNKDNPIEVTLVIKSPLKMGIPSCSSWEYYDTLSISKTTYQTF